MKIIYTTVFLLLASLVYGQKSTLYQNVNVRAKELKHNLNKTGDSLILKCERTIYEVVIFNDDFERVVSVKDTEITIPIADVPIGRYIVEALLSDKLIVITLLRNEPFSLPDTAPLITDTSDLFGTKTKPKTEAVASVEKPTQPTIEAEIKVTEVEKPEPEVSGSETNILKTDIAVAGKKAKPKLTRKVTYTKPQKPAESSLSLFKADKVAAKTQKRSSREVDAARANRIESTYWVEYKINNGQSSQKIQKLGDQDTVDRMIRKIEIDMKTKAGRLNELIIWTVYDPPKFVKHKKDHKNNFTSVPSESFKIEPYYKKVNNPDNL
ncbi:hypothetical protein HNV10_00285 [Winogradskyella litoriviva]|uniref:DUF4476 domain-containing protein n=1 Tax=Winogradskyella litoriviva TaxID=1220182 RepID=A0ABX2DZC5_9FLAO|nr:hypothetical protein [Winogradskyella litoriviva]NRD21657.1 hypothetical protein [Winogradskyella litoriviva]